MTAGTPTVRYASVAGTNGYAIAGHRCFVAMQHAGIDAVWEPQHWDGWYADVAQLDRAAAPPELVATRRPRSDGETLVAHRVPPWDDLVERLRPARLVAHSVWETDVLPPAWLGSMRGADEFWVPTEWNRRVFAAAFDRPVHVIPHVAPATAIEPMPIDLAPDAYVVVCVSAWNWRKRPDLVVEAFLRAHGDDDRAVLVLKTDRTTDSWPSRPELPTAVHVAEIAARVPHRARVIVATSRWSQGQLLGLLGRADCYLSTTMSEGWGLGAFDAACVGAPVLITGFGGQVEWLGTDYPGLLPFRVVPVDHPDDRLHQGGEWAAVDLDATVDALRALRAGSLPTLVDRAGSLREELSSRYSSDRVGQLIRTALGLPGR